MMAEAGREFGLDPVEASAAAEAMRQQAEELREQLKGEGFKLDPQQMDEFRQQMEEFGKSFKTDDFKLDQKQMDELHHQMEQFKQQLEEMKSLSFGDYV
jgi:DNA repair exonuclease SbcCD ATPase subunit